MQTITEEEYTLLPEDLEQYNITLSLWQINWKEVRKASSGDETDKAKQADDNLETLQKALKSCVVTLTNGQQRLLPDVTLFPYPLLAAAQKLLKAAFEATNDVGN